MNIRDRVMETVRSFQMLEGGDRVLVGVSGGQDSTALLHLLVSLKELFPLELGVIHINHCLRGDESERDERFVRETAERLKLVCFVERVDIGLIKKERLLSVQAAGREARTTTFFRVAKENGFNRVAVGHNLNDQGETLLINLLRGTGLKGLGGIHPVYKGRIIRPLIGVSRESISRYLELEGIQFVEDSSNKTTKYTRNRIRHELFPHLERSYNGNLAESLSNLSESCREEEELLSDMAIKSLDKTVLSRESGSIILDSSRFKLLPPAIKRRVLRLAIEEVRGSLKCIGFEHISSLMALVGAAKTGKKYIFQGNAQCRTEYGKIVFSSAEVSPGEEYAYELSMAGTLRVEESQITIKTRLISGDELLEVEESETHKLFDIPDTALEILVRNRRGGDIFHPFGMRGSLKLKKYLINIKVPERERERVPLIVYGGEILWIPRFRRSSRFPVTRESSHALSLSIA